MAARSGKAARTPAARQKELQDAIEKLTFLVSPHIESFDYWVDEGLQRSVEDMDPVEVASPDGRSITYSVTDIKLGTPSQASSLKGVTDRVLPTDCRQSGGTYGGLGTATIVCTTSKGTRFEFTRSLGRIPIMVRSAKCWLHGLGPKEMVAHNEDATEPGGYFIVNGNEKLVRMLIVPRRNYPMAVVRQAYQKRGKAYTTYGTTMRCVRPDQTSITVTVHYLNDGTSTLRFAIRKQEFFLPVVLVLKALVDTSDREIYEKIVQRDHGNTFTTERVELILKDAKQFSVYTRRQCRAYLGERFRVVLGLPASISNEDVGNYLLRRYIFVHLTDDRQKFEVLIVMIRKLYGLVQGTIAEDNQDSPMHQEVLSAGHLYGMHFKEKVEEWLQTIKALIQKDMRTNPTLDFETEEYFDKTSKKAGDVGKKMDYFLATGNLKSNTGLDLMQVSGYTIVAERLNYLRFVSHLRCIHRGAFFAEMKTTTVRKLIADNWGFLCPVHTPDGAPCGLLNHLSSTCKVVAKMPLPEENKAVHQALATLGMTPVGNLVFPKDYVPVMLDGVVLGGFPPALAMQAATRLRHMKATEAGVSPLLEVAMLPPAHGGAFPGLYLFLSPARFLRPVRHLAAGKIELIGSLEQPYLDIACLDEDLKPHTTHQEVKPTHILSVVANLTPFSDFNQSPRNMYQCQMGKQSMGTPVHCFPYRTDNKIYRIQTPQAPVARTNAQDEFHMDDYPNGTNAVVAVISYTGYDMEDAMIINKASYERGFQHGTVYKTEIVDLDGKDARSRKPGKKYFGNVKEGKVLSQAIDTDGLPFVGKLLQPSDPLYGYFDETGKHFIAKYKGKEPAYIDQVRVLGVPGQTHASKAILKLRLNRNPVIGDKFSSRHGQKGVLSQLWPQENMPFSESGMSPDVIINPHAFPSRMTIGMLVESLAGKAGALHGHFQDSTPFKFGEKNTAVSYFGEQLTKAGYNYFGNEPLYSGIFGTEFYADIYIGVVYYQRLRHMVKDKYQVRATGPVHNLTRQPIKGRKLGGGIRFGEMERDSLLAHGAAFLLHDRLMLSSDYHKAYVCNGCGSLLAPVTEHSSATSERKVTCRWCESRRGIKVVALPFVFRYLAVELAAMNIRLVLQVGGKNE